MVYPIGGVCCGLYRKDFLDGVDLLFPEKIRYEDNYWATLIKSCVNRVAFVEKVKYLYRQNSNSTVHKRNDSFQYEDRITIERMVIDEAKKRNLFERYKEAFEFIFVSRYVIGTAGLFVRTFDEIPYQVLKKITRDLQAIFPEFRRNTYYKEIFTWKQRLLNEILFSAPRLFVTIYKGRNGI